MKRCPVCNRTYTDETLNFCLEDGSTLIASNTGASGFGSMPQQNQSWQPQNLTAAHPRKKSKAWLWILGILGVFAVLGFVGLFGLLAFIGSLADNNNNNNNNRTNRTANYNSNRGSNTNVKPNTNISANSNSGLNLNSNPSTTLGSLKYSEMDWGKLDSAFGHGEYIGGEYQVNSKNPDNYYVIIVDSVVKDQYVTKNATTKITARNTSTTASPHLGFGLVVHSDPTPLKIDYAFIIRTDKEPAYRIAKHDNRSETDIVKWTPFPSIRTGTQPNELEVRSDGKTLQFYINGQYATSIADNITSRGIVGLYTSGTPVVAFSDIKIYDNK
ncbi:MAG: hypothetical protein M3209_00615 [Acidobacteriota bacterium]|nr:hypothetical protein [Acidobacteriota bacterium]